MDTFTLDALKVDTEPSHLKVVEHEVTLGNTTYKMHLKEMTQYVQQCMTSMYRFMDKKDPTNAIGEMEIVACLCFCDPNTNTRLLIDVTKAFGPRDKQQVLDEATKLSKMLTVEEASKLSEVLSALNNLKLADGSIASIEIDESNAIKKSEKTEN